MTTDLEQLLEKNISFPHSPSVFRQDELPNCFGLSKSLLEALQPPVTFVFLSVYKLSSYIPSFIHSAFHEACIFLSVSRAISWFHSADDPNGWIWTENLESGYINTNTAKSLKERNITYVFIYWFTVCPLPLI